MANTRYEQYDYSGQKLPFTVYLDIERSPTKYTAAANWHDALEIEWYKSGSGSVFLDGRRLQVGKDDFVVVNSREIHHTLPAEPLRYSCLIVGMQFCCQADIDPNALRFDSLVQDEQLQAAFEALERVYRDLNDVCRVAKLRRSVLDILILLRARYAQNHIGAKRNVNERVQNAIVFIREHYAEKLYLDSIAKSVYVDKYVLAREFKEFTGKTLIQYLNDYRCKVVTDLLAQGKTIAEAAAQCGFNNMSFFSKTFKKHLGELPSAYKKNNR